MDKTTKDALIERAAEEIAFRFSASVSKAYARGMAQAALETAGVFDLAEVAEKAAATFRCYQTLHDAKGSEDGARKAQANVAEAKALESALNRMKEQSND